jgi:ribosomal protein S27E
VKLILYIFRCKDGHNSEMLVKSTVKKITCLECGKVAKRVPGWSGRYIINGNNDASTGKSK